nr:hypothetical protein PAB0470 - Pyrococcus abyssi (strain Orsay) [Pyrococcus abyssi]
MTSLNFLPLHSTSPSISIIFTVSPSNKPSGLTKSSFSGSLQSTKRSVNLLPAIAYLGSISTSIAGSTTSTTLTLPSWRGQGCSMFLTFITLYLLPGSRFPMHTLASLQVLQGSPGP